MMPSFAPAGVYSTDRWTQQPPPMNAVPRPIRPSRSAAALRRWLDVTSSAAPPPDSSDDENALRTDMRLTAPARFGSFLTSLVVFVGSTRSSFASLRHSRQPQQHE